MNILGFDFLAFGNISVACLVLLLVTLLLAGVWQLGIYVFYICVAGDDEYAPKYDFKNKLWDKMVNTFYTTTYYLKCPCSFWVGLGDNGTDTDSSVKYYYCKKAAISAANRFGVPESRVAEVEGLNVVLINKCVSHVVFHLLP